MKTVQLVKYKDQQWEYVGDKQTLVHPLVLVFGNRYMLEQKNIFQEVKTLFPDGEIVFGSSCGEITLNQVHTDSITITAIEFEKTNIEIRTHNTIESNLSSETVGYDLAKKLPVKDLKYVFLISEGSNVNGSALTKGISKGLPDMVVTGALCGDDGRFEKTVASYNENPKEGEIVIIGFYGDTFEATFSVYDGWTPFGPERIITKSKNNILYELDGKPALDLYKKYLGDKAQQLPEAALIYPLNVKTKNSEQSFVRTILGIDEKENAMILAGNVPEESSVQLMMTNMNSIANASEIAATQAMKNRKNEPQLAILVSCIGRKLVLDQRIEEEVEEVTNIVGNKTVLSGLYSYGEIAPHYNSIECQLHNQTMAITLLSE